MSNNLLDVIKEIFRSYNYSVSTVNQDYDLLAKKAGNGIAIKVVNGVSADDVKEFAGSIKTAKAKGLMISLAEFSEDAKKAAKQQDLLLWDRPELERQIGKAVLVGFESAEKQDIVHEEAEAAPADISALTRELYAKPSEKPKAASKAVKKPEPKQVELEPPAEEPEVVEAPAEEEEDTKIPLHAIPPKVKMADAVRISGNIGRAEDLECSMKFIPFWKYDYSLDVMSKYKDVTVPLNGKGSKIINAINKAVFPTPAAKPVESVDLPDAPYNIEMALLTQEEAVAMAVKTIIEEHSKQIRFKATIGEAAMVEHKKFSPKPSDIRMQIEMLYIPFWAIRSHKGYMEINALDGKPTQMPIDDGAEIL
jgi:hypothetical protein